MRGVGINQYEKISSTDIDNLQKAVQQGIQDDLIYNLFGSPASGVLSTGFLASFVSTFAVSLNPGLGFLYNNANTGFNPKNQAILSLASIAVTIAANSNANNRIDLICLAPNQLATIATASRYVKTGGVGPITLTTVPKQLQDTYTLQVVAGTPSGSPATPATPSGYIAIATVLNRGSSAGMSGSGAITDVRIPMGITGSNVSVVNTNHVYLTGLTIQTQFDEADTAIVNAVGVIKAINPATQSPYAMSTTLLTGDAGKIFLVNSANGAMQFNLPAPSVGFWFTVKDIAGSLGTNGCTFHRFSTELFAGLAADYVANAPGGEWTVRTDGTNWFITGR